MKKFSSAPSLPSRSREAVVLLLAILIGILCSVTQAPAAPLALSKKNVSALRKQNKRYANACELLREKWRAKQERKAKVVKYR
jgi:hypothetical protein